MFVKRNIKEFKKKQINQKNINVKFKIATENFTKKKKMIKPIGIIYKLIILFNSDKRNFELITTKKYL